MLSLAWQYPRDGAGLPSPDPALAYRKIYYNTVDDFATASLYDSYPVPLERADVIDLVDGTTYYFWVVDTNKGNIDSLPSQSVSGTYIDCCLHGGTVCIPDCNGDNCTNINCEDIVLLMPLNRQPQDLSTYMRVAQANGGNVEIVADSGQWGCNSLQIQDSQNYVNIDALDGLLHANGDYFARAQVKITNPAVGAHIIFEGRGSGNKGGHTLFVEASELVLGLTYNSGFMFRKVKMPFPHVDTWAEVAFSRSGDTWRVFVNGVMGAEYTEVNYQQPVDNLFRIGADAYGQSPLNGLIDDIEIMRKALHVVDYTPAIEPVAACVEGEDPENPEKPVDPGPEDFEAGILQVVHYMSGKSLDFELDGKVHICRLLNDLTTINASLPAGAQTGSVSYGAELFIEAPIYDRFTLTIPGSWQFVGGDNRTSITLYKGDPGVVIALWTDIGSTAIKYSLVIPQVLL